MSLVNVFPDIVVDRHDHVTVITINRPSKLNAMTRAMSYELARVAEASNDDAHTRVVVLTGAGGRAFCAGSDVSELDDYETPWAFRNRFDYCDSIRRLRKPVIAAVNGYTLGGGLELALSCDIRLAARSATFAAPEIKLGWIGGGGMCALLADSIGPSNTALMTMTGDPIDAARAHDWHLVSEVTEPEVLLARALEVARTIAERAPIAAETAKANIHAARNVPLDRAIGYERDLQAITFATSDAREGRAAFAEKRQPTFEGK